LRLGYKRLGLYPRRGSGLPLAAPPPTVGVGKLQAVPKLGVGPWRDAPSRLLDLGKGPGTGGCAGEPLFQETDHHLLKGSTLLGGFELKAAVEGVREV